MPLSYAYPTFTHVSEAAPVILAKIKGDATVTVNAAFHAGYVVEGFGLSLALPDGVAAADPKVIEEAYAACPALAELRDMSQKQGHTTGVGGILDSLLAIVKMIKTFLDTLPI